MSNDAAFYIIWTPNHSKSPTVQHGTHGQALTEAKRLARQNRGAQFYVCKAVDRMVVDDVQHTPLTDPDEIPF